MRNREELAIDIVSAIDEDIVEKNLVKRFELWFTRKQTPKKNKWVPILASVASFAIILTSVFMLWSFLKAPVYLGMTVSNQAPIVNTASLDVDYLMPMEISAEDASLVPMYLTNTNYEGNNGNHGNKTEAPTITEAPTTTEEPTNAPPDVFESKTYYAMPGEDIYIYVHISNPNEYEILSFTLNGVKYSSYMFEPGSDLETLILKYNVGDTMGLMEYTIDAIKYVDGESIKDVRMKGDQTIEVVVGSTNDDLALDFLAIGDMLMLTPTLQDVLMLFPNVISVEVYNDTELVMQCTAESFSLFSFPLNTKLLLVVNYTVDDVLQKSMHVFDSPGESKDLRREGAYIAGSGFCRDEIVILDTPVMSLGNMQSARIIVLGNGVTSVSSGAFADCMNVSTIVIPSDHPVYRVENNCIIEKQSNSIVTCVGENIIVPDSVTDISAYAFSNCSNMTSITLHDNITSIGKCAFFGCTALTDITMPQGVTKIDTYAFSGCSALTDIIIPEGVTNIPAYAFSNCSNMTSITLHDNITSIGKYAFAGCGALSEITIPEGVTDIEGYAFSKCTSLTSITVPQGLTYIAAGAFYECRSLTSLIISAEITDIGNYAFYNCLSLNAMVFDGSKAEWDAIHKKIYWMEGSVINQIQCTDGNISID